MQIRDRATIKIDSVAFGGEGVGRMDKLVVFIPFSAPGDELEIEITRVKKTFLRGRILSIIRQSPQRAKPLCRYYEQCGGCCYQHIRYEHQLKIKQRQVEEAFRKIGKFPDPPVLHPIASPKSYHYRGKAQYHMQTVSGRRQTGFLDVSGSRLVDIERCEIMDETINEQLCVLRKNKKLHEKDLTIWSDGGAGKFGQQTLIKRFVQGEEFLVPREDFFQANLYLTDRLVEEVCRFVSADKTEHVVDAYCGSGLFAIFLSRLAAKVTGVEISERAVECARINARHLGAKNAEFICSDFEEALRKALLPAGNETGLMVLDPPRVGCKSTALKAIADWGPQKMIYISCNPATQARDIRFFCDRGYHLSNLLPLDMFPQTEHIEVIGLLEREKSRGNK